MIEYAVMPLSDYKYACDNIRAKTEGTLPITSNELASKIDEVFNAGQAEGSANATILYGTYVIKENITFEEVGGIYVDEDVSGKNIYAYFYDNDTQSYHYKKIIGMIFESTRMPICWYTDDGMQTALVNGKWECSSNGVRGNLPNSKGRIIVFTEPTFITTDFYNAFTSAIDEGFDIFADGKQDGISEGIEQGKQEYESYWWDIRQKYGNPKSMNYEHAFYMFPGELFKPKYDFIFSTDYSANGTFRYATMTDMQKDCYFTYMPNPSTSGVTSTFDRCGNLVNARTLHCPSGLKWSNTAFRECNALVEIRFAGVIDTNGLNLQWSTKLSKASWENIIGCLSATSSGLSMTGSLASVNKAFETSEGANDGSTSTEWLNLIATKPNWSIKLV